MAFVDYEKAFDSIETWAVLESLQRCRIDWRYIEVLRCLYNAATMTVQIQDRRAKPIPLRRGVRQGDVISPKLFTNAMEDVFKTLEWNERGININGERISHLRFADDIVVFAETLEGLTDMLNSLNESSRRVGLGMNLDKTKVMFNEHVMPRPVNVDGSPLEVVQEYVYLLQKIQVGKHGLEREANRRIQLGWAAFGNLRHVFSSTIPQYLKTKVFEHVNKAERARLLAVSKWESGLWLQALPSSNLGTLLDAEIKSPTNFTSALVSSNVFFVFSSFFGFFHLLVISHIFNYIELNKTTKTSAKNETVDFASLCVFYRLYNRECSEELFIVVVGVRGVSSLVLSLAFSFTGLPRRSAHQGCQFSAFGARYTAWKMETKLCRSHIIGKDQNKKREIKQALPAPPAYGGRRSVLTLRRRRVLLWRERSRDVRSRSQCSQKEETASHPVSHSTLKEYLKSYVNDNQDNWYKYLPTALISYNSTTHSTTNFSPHELLFGCKPYLPINRRKIRYHFNEIKLAHDNSIPGPSRQRRPPRTTDPGPPGSFRSGFILPVARSQIVLCVALW
ncbi:hypothetical protein K1T71_005496 [Dendrolimus kikuchii]|uniref:Uncharacterized protein n=1 Tax=Dendrolimus kikuchii TaxID=765133 RepID=A0ACC1D4E8_9NEOP|nr:hypothetical protein K1T71_005496 [Dendrolimus kikuchii]